MTVELQAARIANYTSKGERKVACENALDSWLGGHSAKRGNEIIYCVTVMALETWVLAVHDQAELARVSNVPMVVADYDHLQNPETLLLALDYTGSVVGGQRRLRKSVGHFSK